MTTYLDCWIAVAGSLFAQALTGEPELVETVLRPCDAALFGFSATIEGEVEGGLWVGVDAAVLELSVLGEGQEQKSAWGELLREISEAAAGELYSRVGIKCRVSKFEPMHSEGEATRTFQMRFADRVFTLLICDQVRAAAVQPAPQPNPTQIPEIPPVSAGPGIELLMDVELEATLRFGCRELPLGEILELGPGDVVQLDRHVSEPVDLLVGDKIVARGDVVLVNGNFALRVTEVAVPRKRLETIRCLF
jgi:flagellar motor switch protein FliN